MTLLGIVYSEKKEAVHALLRLCQTMLSPEPTPIGTYRGFTLLLGFDSYSQAYHLSAKGCLMHTVALGGDAFGNLQRIDNLLEGLPNKLQSCKEQLHTLYTQVETAKTEIQKPFAREDELTVKLARLEELNTLLSLDDTAKTALEKVEDVER